MFYKNVFSKVMSEDNNIDVIMATWPTIYQNLLKFLSILLKFVIVKSYLVITKLENNA